jgi:hypothetical protein
LCSEAVFEVIISALEKIPAPPIPAMARPMIRIVEFGDTPHKSEPISKMKRDKR